MKHGATPIGATPQVEPSPGHDASVLLQKAAERWTGTLADA
jgi:hypothetical protein